MLAGAPKQSVAHCAEAFRDNVTLLGTMCGALSELVKSVGGGSRKNQPQVSQEKREQKSDTENDGEEIIVIDD